MGAGKWHISLDLLSIYANTYITGWWFQTWFFYFPYGMSSFHWRTPSFFKMVKTTNQKILSNASNCQSTSPLNRWQNLRCLRRPLQRHRDAFFCRSDKFDPFLAYLLHTRYYHHPFHLVTSSYCSKEDHPQMASFQQCSLVTGNDSRPIPWEFRSTSAYTAHGPVSGPSLPMRRAMQLTPSRSVFPRSGGSGQCAFSGGGI